MATTAATKTTTTTDKPKRVPPTLVERTKSQLSTAALRGKIKPDELDILASHIEKLKALLA